MPTFFPILETCQAIPFRFSQQHILKQDRKGYQFRNHS